MHIYWTPEADARAEQIMDEHGTELSQEAERIARRMRSGAVSIDYVEEAAFTIRVRRPSGAVPELMVDVGIAMLGIAGGVLGVILTEPSGTHLKLGWVGAASIAVACVGFFLTGIGGTLKVKSG